MDVVITYVDGLDPQWRQDYAATVGMETMMAKRFRDWGTLPYLLRGVERCIPDLGEVYLVVASESQVPSWTDTSRLHIVLHRDIIPERFLPLFNSSSIEMFLQRIPDLSERYLYLNDDFYPLLPFSLEEFYPGGKAAIYMKKQALVLGNEFRYLVRHSDRLARRAAGLGPSPLYIRPQHTAAPMLSSAAQRMYSLCEDEILASITKIRCKVNYNQYIFSDYMYYSGLTAQQRISNKHFSLSVAGIDKITSFLDNPGTKMVCINDVNIGEDTFRSYRTRLLDAFARRFPQKSRFEI